MSRPPVPGYVVQRWTQDGDLLAVAEMIHGQGRLIIGDEYGVEDAWCYASVAEAWAAWITWDGTGEPHGWFRHPFTGRRRPGGDPSQEYVNR